MEVGNLFVRLSLRAQEFSRGLSDAERQLQQTQRRFEGFTAMGDRFKNLGQSLTIGLTAPIVAAGAAVSKLAIDAVESENLFTVSMGGMASAATEWSKSLSASLGLNEYELRKNVGMLNAMFNSMGLGTQAAYQMSTGLTQLAYDMSSFYNLKPEEAFEKLRAGITGETEPLKALGILVDENTIKTYAYKNGIAATGAELTEAQKVAARYGAILEQTSDAQGDLARTADSPANQIRILKTRMEELGVVLGKNIIPGITKVVSAFNRWALSFKNISPESQKLIIYTLGIVAAIGPLLFGIGLLIKSVATAAVGVKALTLAFNWLNRAIITNPIGLLITAIIALVAAIAYLTVAWYKNWNGIRDKTASVVKVITSYFNSMVNAIATAFNKMKARVYDIVASILNAVAPLASLLPSMMQGAFEGARAAVAQKSEDISLHLEELQLRTEEATEKTGEAVTQLKEAFSSWVTPAAAAGMEDFNTQAEEAKNTIMDYKDLDKNLIPLEEGLGKVGNAGKKSAEDTRKEWEKTSELLSVRLEIIQTKYDAAGISAEQSGDKVKTLVLRTESLNKQMLLQKEIISAVNQGLTESVKEYGETAEETEKLRLKVEQENKALVEMKKALFDTNKAIKDHVNELRSLSDEVTEVERKYREGLASALEDYQKQVQDVNTKLASDEKKLTADYDKELISRTRSLSNFVGLFDEVTQKDISGTKLLDNLRGQVEAFESWEQNIASLAAKGVDEGLIAELKEMGPKAAPEIEALNKLTDSQLNEYVNLWSTKNAEARKAAVDQLQAQKEEMNQKLREIRNVAAVQLEAYRIEWEKKNAEIYKNTEEEMKKIKEKFREVAESGTEYGSSLVANFVGGMESQFGNLKNTLESMAILVDSYMPHSPAKRGPLRRIKEWGPALVGSLVDGIKNTLPNLESITARMAGITPAALSVAGSTTNNNNSGGNTIYITVTGGVEELKRELRKSGVRL